ncbi:hypothetical protein AOL_s00054g792 [Orbilia oligospora ATCC 24927]|uniref:Peptidase M12A domain-containing protein n=1 Tax=Arthrobotrys oligospora (strain ATCC 24927 / CBS 115.81 / DSM 1491) TaxID=756982 RepID=G1X7E8_ARTOA|nr:hypothetical protein AOL_s00054g792 [Orbilia oligospora ATCC 24927]EGX51056.1 hypothetical protein AOL_s00054g792 [Orbilia oligospora ATCC 24927]
MVDPSEICTLMPLDEDTQYGNTQANDNSNDFLGNLIRRKYMGTGVRLGGLKAHHKAHKIPGQNLTQTVPGNTRWETGQTIKIRLGGKSDVRISFDQYKDSYSYLGTNAITIPQDTATMNLALNDHTTTERVRAVVLHEFGHLLGCIHEHSSPASSIPWNEEAVYDFYQRTNGWDRAKTCHNVLRKYDRNTISQFSEFDPKSIMIYTIDESVLLPGNSRFVTSWNTRLSATDKEFIGKLYPFPEGEERPRRSKRTKKKRL